MRSMVRPAAGLAALLGKTRGGSSTSSLLFKAMCVGDATVSPCGGSSFGSVRRASSSATPSVVESALNSTQIPRGVEIKPGEVLVFASGPGARRIILGHWLSSAIVSAYVLISNIAAMALPVSSDAAAGLANAAAASSGAGGVVGTGVGLGASLMSSQSGWFSALMAGAAVAFTSLAVSSSRAQVRAAVLTADGHHLRVYTYSPYMGVGTREPIVLPVKLLSLAGGPGDKASDPGKVSVASPINGGGSADKVVEKKGSKFTEDLFVRVNGSTQSILFDKPADLLDLARVKGPGLIFNEKGLASIDAGPAAAPAGTATPGGPLSPFSLTPSSLYAYSPEVRDAVRRYALLVRLLGGSPVADMNRLREGSWELENMSEQLGGSHHSHSQASSSSGGSQSQPHGALASRVADLVYWRQATDAKSGRPYWWHTATSASQWLPPMVDGKTPYDWHPHLKDI